MGEGCLPEVVGCAARFDKQQVLFRGFFIHNFLCIDYLFLFNLWKTECMKTDILLCARFGARCIRLWQFVDVLVAEAAVNAGHGLV